MRLGIKGSIMQAIVNISLKNGVLDPQGRAISRALGDLGFNEVNDVRVGKQIQLDIDETDPARLRQRVARMCETLLSNTVIEDYTIVIPDEQ
jgi:phosphoribosylformylglycinamidine synthase PurS subunit